MKLFITLMITLALIILGLSFGAQNDTQVTVNYLIAKGSFSLPLIIALVLVVGFCLGWLAMIASYTALRLRYLNLLRQQRKLSRLVEKANP